ncbi:hypothetical protein L211DRAFT_854110 [Terfezia boudieri ATCC MYA-4762]|uniref:Uncharacterized protein n=1 Tax=Terfezia boudieri ATCC MYA-4762 TaxID=1051890 RepID=A0A3N4L6E1_9PEZI|nr:hypothetical protein L211DRAFT_854110 [Terfezia boudieri ATCC MYA-4762]
MSTTLTTTLTSTLTSMSTTPASSIVRNLWSLLLESQKLEITSLKKTCEVRMEKDPICLGGAIHEKKDPHDELYFQYYSRVSITNNDEGELTPMTTELTNATAVQTYLLNPDFFGDDSPLIRNPRNPLANTPKTGNLINHYEHHEPDRYGQKATTNT